MQQYHIINSRQDGKNSVCKLERKLFCPTNGGQFGNMHFFSS